MKILAVDSTAKTATVALCDDRTMLAEFTLNNGNTHSETLLPMIESVLNAFGIARSGVRRHLNARSTGAEP